MKKLKTYVSSFYQTVIAPLLTLILAAILLITMLSHYIVGYCNLKWQQYADKISDEDVKNRDIGHRTIEWFIKWIGISVMSWLMLILTTSVIVTIFDISGIIDISFPWLS